MNNVDISWKVCCDIHLRAISQKLLRYFVFNTLRPRRNGHYNIDDIFKCIFLKENVWIPTKISPKFVPKGPINNIPTLVQIMAWRHPGDKPLSEPMMVSLLAHICVTRPQWVNTSLEITFLKLLPHPLIANELTPCSIVKYFWQTLSHFAVVTNIIFLQWLLRIELPSWANNGAIPLTIHITERSQESITPTHSPVTWSGWNFDMGYTNLQSFAKTIYWILTNQKDAGLKFKLSCAMVLQGHGSN